MTKQKSASRWIWITMASLLVVAGLTAAVAARVRAHTEPSAPDSTVEGTSGIVPEPAPFLAEPVGEGRSTTDDYRASVISMNSEIGHQLDALTMQLIAPKYDDAAWREQTNGLLGSMVDTAARARSIEPTPEYAASHQVWLEGIDDYAWAAENMTVALAGPDYGLLTQCNDRLTQASSHFREATTLMQQVVVD